MREPCITTDHLRDQYSGTDKPFWEACHQAFEQMFAPVAQDLDRIGPHCFGEVDESRAPEPICPLVDSENWLWYVQERAQPAAHTRADYEPDVLEKTMYDWFRQTRPFKAKKILIVHGRTGIGKTTFVKHFFARVLPQLDIGAANKTFALRVSMPLVGAGGKALRRAEDNFDHDVYRWLTATFTQGRYDLGEPDNLIEMAALESPKPEREREIFATTDRPPLGYAAQLRWIREHAVGRSGHSDSEQDDGLVSDFADFNRLAIRYLCQLDGELRLIFFLDNVDHLPVPLQKNAWLLARHKLSWIDDWDRVMFIVAIRSYLLENAAKEGAIQAYFGKTAELKVYPPSLYTVLARRKAVFFDPHCPKRTDDDADRPKVYVASRGRRIPVYCPNEMLDGLLMAFRERRKHAYVEMLCNGDLRQGLEMAKAAAEFPFYDWGKFADMVYKQYRRGHGEAQQLVTVERLIEAIVRRTNRLCEPALPFFDNVFDVDASEHFANSLSKLFILQMLRERTHSVTRVLRNMEVMGHPRHMTELALERLLMCNIVTSPQGISLEGHEVRRVTSKGTSLCNAYSNELSTSLMYVQSMAYVTPLDESLCDTVPLPTQIQDDDRDFEARVEAAAVLVRQIEKDSDAQSAYIQGLKGEENRDAQKVYVEYECCSVVDRIKKGIRADLDAIKYSGKCAGANWMKLSNFFL